MGVALVSVVMLALMEPASAMGLNLLSSLLFFSLHYSLLRRQPGF
jgi:hypothetical protein